MTRGLSPSYTPTIGPSIFAADALKLALWNQNEPADFCVAKLPSQYFFSDRIDRIPTERHKFMESELPITSRLQHLLHDLPLLCHSTSLFLYQYRISMRTAHSRLHAISKHIRKPCQ